MFDVRIMINDEIIWSTVAETAEYGMRLADNSPLKWDNESIKFTWTRPCGTSMNMKGYYKGILFDTLSEQSERKSIRLDERSEAITCIIFDRLHQTI